MSPDTPGAAAEPSRPGPAPASARAETRDRAAAPADVPALLALLGQVSEPRLTWYGRDGDRVELSGRVLVNWVAKSAHLLVEDLDARQGEIVLVELGTSWRAPALWLAGWHVGCQVVEAPAGRRHRAGPGGGATTGERGSTPEGPAADVLVVADGAVPPVGTERLAVVALHPLARAAEAVPPGAVDYAAEVASHDDQLPPPGAARARPWDDGDVVGGRRLLGPRAEPRELLGVWAGGGSVVWHEDLDEATLQRIVADERVDIG